MYQAIQSKVRSNPRQVVSLMAKDGENYRDLPQLLDTKYALTNRNYLITSDGGLKKRRGLKKYFNVPYTWDDSTIWDDAAIWLDYLEYPITFLKQFTSDIIIFAWQKTVAAYKLSTNEITVIKNDWTTDDKFSGVRWGEYFYICNGGDKIYYIDTSLSITELANSPKAKVLYTFDKRLFAGNLNTGTWKVAYSKQDDGTNPPFTDWTVTTAATAAGMVSNRFCGEVKSISSLGNNIVVFGTDGKYAFQITTLDVGGTLQKTETEVMSRADEGGYASVLTEKGLFYVNKSGLYQLVSVGQQNVPFSDQESLISKLLGSTFFKDVNLDYADIIFDDSVNSIYITCAKNSLVNNYIIGYNTENKALFHFTGWNINNFMSLDGGIYGGSALDSNVYKLFEGYSDDGRNIETEFIQEVTLGALDTSKMLEGGYFQGYLSPSTTMEIHFDIYNVTGGLEKDKLILSWTKDGINIGDGYGLRPYTSPYGTNQTDSVLENMSEVFSGFKDYIRNFQRLRIRFYCNDKAPHIINWFKLDAQEKVQIRRRDTIKLN